MSDPFQSQTAWQQQQDTMNKMYAAQQAAAQQQQQVPGQLGDPLAQQRAKNVQAALETGLNRGYLPNQVRVRPGGSADAQVGMRRPDSDMSNQSPLMSAILGGGQ